MFERRKTLSFAVIAIMLIILSADQVSAQTAGQDSSRAADQAEVGDIEGDVTTNFEFVITAQPARPLIQFTNNRPNVSFTEVRVGPSSRSFYPELRLGSEMEIGSPAIDILVLFPGIIP